MLSDQSQRVSVWRRSAQTSRHQAATDCHSAGAAARAGPVLALHELATNAHKYGALSVEPGRVDLSWQIDRTDKPVCKFRWAEGDGPLVQPPSRRGLGQYLLKAQKGLASVDIRYAPTGVVCEIAVQLAEDSERASKAPPAAVNIETG